MYLYPYFTFNKLLIDHERENVITGLAPHPSSKSLSSG